MSAAIFDTTEYESSHGRAPRGRGSWAFIPGAPRHYAMDDVVWVPGSHTLTEAKRLVRQMHPTVTVWGVAP